jgi:hypothetical protein
MIYIPEVSMLYDSTPVAVSTSTQVHLAASLFFFLHLKDSLSEVQEPIDVKWASCLLVPLV